MCTRAPRGPDVGIAKGHSILPEAMEKDRSGLHRTEGVLKKRSTRGRWQSRYFALVNHYMNYFANAKRTKLLGSIDLCTVEGIDLLDMSGSFELQFYGGSVYALRAKSMTAANEWVECLRERKARYPAKRPGSGRQPGRAHHTRKYDRDEDYYHGDDSGGDGGLRDAPGRRRRQRGHDTRRHDRDADYYAGSSDGGGDSDGNAGHDDDDDGDGGSDSDSLGPMTSFEPTRVVGKSRRASLLDRSSMFKQRWGETLPEDARATPAASDTSDGGGGHGSGGGDGGSSDTDSVGGSAAPPATLAAAVDAPASSDSRRRDGDRGSGPGSRRRGRSPAAKPPPADVDVRDADAATGSRSAAAAAPPPPSHEGRLQKRSPSLFHKWQTRYLRLVDNALYYYKKADDQQHQSTIPVAAVTNVARKDGHKSATKFTVSTAWGRDFDFKCSTELDAVEWVRVIRAAMEYLRVQSRKGAVSPVYRRPPTASTAGGHDSDSDADEYDGANSGMVLLPPWLRRFQRLDDGGRIEALEEVVHAYFRDNVDDEGEPSLSKVVDAGDRLRERLDDLLNNCMQLPMRSRTALMRPILGHFSLRMLQEFSPFITGSGPARLSPTMLLQVIDALEAYNVTTSRVTKALEPVEGEDSRDALLQSSVNDAIERYMAKIGPKLHGYVDEILSRLLGDKTGSQVKPRVGTRLGTSAPTDLFHLMQDSLEIVRHKSSPTLQRLILSLVMKEVMLFSREVLTDVQSTWAADKAGVSLAYICGIVNDAGALLDHLEHLEAYFAIAIHGGSTRTGDTTSSDEVAMIEQNVAVTKGEILSDGLQLVDVLVSIITSDLTEPMGQLFTQQWLAGNLVEVACVTAKDYLDELKPLLDPYFFERVAVLVLAHIAETYLGKLFATRKGRMSALFSSFKLTPQRLAKVVKDVDTLESYFRPYMGRETLVPATRLPQFIKEVVNTPEDGLLDMFELGVRQDPHCALHVYNAFEACLTLRPDVDKKARTALLDSAIRNVLDFGEPPATDSDVLAPPSSTEWKALYIPTQTLHRLFPTAREEAFEFFASNRRSPTPRASTAGGGAAAGAGAIAAPGGESGSASEPVNMDMSSFLTAVAPPMVSSPTTLNRSDPPRQVRSDSGSLPPASTTTSPPRQVGMPSFGGFQPPVTSDTDDATDDGDGSALSPARSAAAVRERQRRRQVKRRGGKRGGGNHTDWFFARE